MSILLLYGCTLCLYGIYTKGTAAYDRRTTATDRTACSSCGRKVCSGSVKLDRCFLAVKTHGNTAVTNSEQFPSPEARMNVMISADCYQVLNNVDTIGTMLVFCLTEYIVFDQLLPDICRMEESGRTRTRGVCSCWIEKRRNEDRREHLKQGTIYMIYWQRERYY